MSVAMNWVTSTGEFIAALKRDYENLRKCSDKSLQDVASISPPLSDPHQHGKSVRIVRFHDGTEFVYKPRDLKPEQAWNAFLDWLRVRLPECCPRSIRVIAMNGYGWTEKLTADPCENVDMVKNFYRKSGMLLGLSYFLNSRDLHHENIIASGSDPMIVDLETIMSSVTAPPTGVGLGESIKNDFSGSGLVGLVRPLPSCKESFARGFDFFTEHALQEILYVLTPNGFLTATSQDVVVASLSNLPSMNGNRIGMVDYKSFIMEGLKALCDLVLRESEAFTKAVETCFRDCDLRLVLLSTVSYHAILKVALTKESLRSESAFFGSLKAAISGIQRTSGLRLAHSSEASIYRALARLDIPRQWQRADSTSIRCDDDIEIAYLSDGSPMDCARQRITTFSRRDRAMLVEDLASAVASASVNKSVS